MKLAGEWSALGTNFDQAAVERAIAEFRAGRPVLLREETQLALAVGVEAVLDRAFDPDDVADGFSRLVLPPGPLPTMPWSDVRISWLAWAMNSDFRRARSTARSRSARTSATARAYSSALVAVPSRNSALRSDV